MTRRKLTKIGGAVVLCLTIFGFSNDRGSAGVDLEDRKLEAFVTAAAAADGVMEIWQPRISRAEGRQIDALRDRANTEIRASIEKVEGISLTEYRAIREAIASDSETLARVTEIMRRRR